MMSSDCIDVSKIVPVDSTEETNFESIDDEHSISGDNCSSSDSGDNRAMSSSSELLLIPLDESIRDNPLPTNSIMVDADNGASSKNICMGIAMKEICRAKSINVDSSMDADSWKENSELVDGNDRMSFGLRHRSLLRTDNSSLSELNRSSSVIVSSPRVPPRVRNRNCAAAAVDSARSSGGVVMRKGSRKALSAVVESTSNNTDGGHRSRSPNVKSLIKMYEERNKVISADELLAIDGGSSQGAILGPM